MRFTATFEVTFEMKEGQNAPDNQANILLNGAVGRFKTFLEHGAGGAPTGVVPGSAKVEITSGPTRE